MEELNSRAGQHRISLVNREVCAINGVSDVLSFDVGEVLLETEQGMLMIRGSELHVSRLTLEKGEVDIDRSEERRVGKECASMCRSRWSPYH